MLYDDELYVACGLCVDEAPFDALAVDDYAIMDWAACMGCGVCISQCPQEAISLRRDPAKGEPLEIQKLIAEAAEATQGQKR